MNEFPLVQKSLEMSSFVKRSLEKSSFRLGLILCGIMAFPLYADTTDSSADTFIDESISIDCEPTAEVKLLIQPDDQLFLKKKSFETNQFIRLSLNEKLNPHKISFQCLSDQKFQIISSPAFSNRVVQIQFSIKENSQSKLSTQPITENSELITETENQDLSDSFEVTIGQRTEYDPTEQMLEKAKFFAITGNKEKLDQLDLAHIDFAYQYVNADRVVSLLKAALTSCEQRPCKPVILTTFELITRLSYSISDSKRDSQSPLAVISAFDDLGVSIADSSQFLLRYVEILRSEGNSNVALSIVSEMARRETPVAELYLIYGDLLWKTGSTEEAKNQYRHYVQLIGQDGRPPLPRIARLLE